MGPIAACFPVVGAFIGLLMSLVWWIGFNLVDPTTSAIFAIAVGAIVTGAFHHDGLADSLDGLVGGWTPEQRREILKDSRHGTYGVLALVIQVAMQISLLSALGSKSGVVVGAIGIVLSQSVGRASAVWVMRSGNGITEGLGANYVRDVKRRHIFVSAFCAVVLTCGLIGTSAVYVLIGAAVVPRLFSRWAIGRIGGIVGDVLGATEQIGETVVLLVLLILSYRGVDLRWW